MTEIPSMYSNLNYQTKFRLNKINKMKDYFNAKIQKRQIMSKKLSKYIATVDYFASIIGVPIGIAGTSFSLIFSLTAGNVTLPITRNKKKKHSKIVIPARSKLISIETIISQALIDLETSHE